MELKNDKSGKRAKIKIDHRQPFGAVMAQYMERDRWSGADLAREVGCTRNHISEILSGKCYPSYSLGMKITSVFGCELRWGKIPSIPKSSRKKGGAVEASAEAPVVESSLVSEEVTPASENGSSKDKLKKFKDLQDKTSTAKKAGEE